MKIRPKERLRACVKTPTHCGWLEAVSCVRRTRSVGEGFCTMPQASSESYKKGSRSSERIPRLCEALTVSD